MIPDNIIESVSGTLILLGAIGAGLKRAGILHIGKRNNGKNGDKSNGWKITRVCPAHDDLVNELIETKDKVSEVKSDTSYIKGWIEAQPKK